MSTRMMMLIHRECIAAGFPSIASNSLRSVTTIESTSGCSSLLSPCNHQARSFASKPSSKKSASANKKNPSSSAPPSTPKDASGLFSPAALRRMSDPRLTVARLRDPLPTTESSPSGPTSSQIIDRKKPLDLAVNPEKLSNERNIVSLLHQSLSEAVSPSSLHSSAKGSGSALELKEREVERKTWVHFRPFLFNNIFQSAPVIASYVASALEQEMSWQRIERFFISSIEGDEIVKGIKVRISGRLGRKAEIASIKDWTWGDHDLAGTVATHVDYGSASALTRAGVLGVKVWLKLHEHAVPENHFTRKTGFSMPLSKILDAKAREREQDLASPGSSLSPLAHLGGPATSKALWWRNPGPMQTNANRTDLAISRRSKREERQMDSIPPPPSSSSSSSSSSDDSSSSSSSELEVPQVFPPVRLRLTPDGHFEFAPDKRRHSSS